MSYGEQQKEIETIRERKITVNLSDADCDRLARKCGEHGLTIGELIENFVGDLVGGTYSNGSDERDYADQWFERCWFGMFPEPTLLNHLLKKVRNVSMQRNIWCIQRNGIRPGLTLISAFPGCHPISDGRQSSMRLGVYLLIGRVWNSGKQRDRKQESRI